MSDVETAVGQEFDVAIDAVPSSGFRWELSSDADAVRLLDVEFEASSDLVGGPAVQRFRFEAVASGEIELRFGLRRPWESEPPAEERAYRVTIRP